MNRAQQLGQLGGRQPKNFTKAELARRKQRLSLARLKRWPKKPAMTEAQFKKKHGHSSAGCCVMGLCGSAAAADVRLMSRKT